jgi:predicted transcriptional regulator
MTRDEYYGIIEKFKADMACLGISQAAAAKALGVSAKTVGNYLNGVTEMDKAGLRRMQVFLRKEEFYRGYCYIEKGEFAKLFSELWYKFKSIKSTEEICSALGLTLSEVNHVKENRKSFDVKKQYDILTSFYNMCFDVTGVYFAGFENTGEMLYNTLGSMFSSALTDKFADTLKDALSKLDFELTYEVLAERSGVQAEDIKDLCESNDFPFNVWDKTEILIALQYFCRKKGSVRSMGLYRELSWIIAGSYGSRPPEELKSEINALLNRRTADFKKRPAHIQKIILGHRKLFFDFYEAYPEYWMRYKTAEKFSDEWYECFSVVNDFDMFRSITEKFRVLSEEDKAEVMDMLKKDFKMPLPDWKSGKEPHCFGVCTECFDMASLAERGQLSPDITSHEIIAYDTCGLDAGIWDYYHSDRTDYMLSLNSMEWCLWGMMAAKVAAWEHLDEVIDFMKVKTEKNTGSTAQ